MAKVISIMNAIAELAISAYSSINIPYIHHSRAPMPLRHMVALESLFIFPKSCGMDAVVEHIAANTDIINIKSRIKLSKLCI
jgi:hypothetical protein